MKRVVESKEDEVEEGRESERGRGGGGRGKVYRFSKRFFSLYFILLFFK